MKLLSTKGELVLVTIRAGPDWFVDAGATHASTVISFDAWTALLTFDAAPAEEITVDALTVNPPPGTHDTLPGSAMLRFRGAPEPESATVAPAPSVKSYLTTSPGVRAADAGASPATVTAAKRLATMASVLKITSGV
jgi:hypothetical protein